MSPRKDPPAPPPSLLDQVAVPGFAPQDAAAETAWVEVVQKMDEIYADLVRYQVALEEKNLALEQAHNFINGVLAAMSDVLIVCDTEGRILETNRALELLTGLPPEECTGRPFAELFSGESQPLAARFTDHMRSTAPVHDCEVSLAGADGHAVPLSMNCSPHYDHSGRLIGMVLIGRPVGELRRAYEALNRTHAELKEAQQQVVQSEKMASLGRLVAGVAHELNNPISFIYGNMHALERYRRKLESYLQALHGGMEPAACDQLRRELRIDRLLGDLAPLVEGSLEGAERVRDIVDDLKRFSSSQRGPRTPFNLTEVVERGTRWALKEVHDTVTVTSELPPEMTVTGYAGQIQQVVINLVQNAVDALRNTAAPRLEIGGRVEGEAAVITFRDNGPGIPAENLHKLFDPFFTTKPVGEGTGLGLSISYRMIREHGGQLSAANHPEGGALFTLRLPLSS